MGVWFSFRNRTDRYDAEFATGSWKPPQNLCGSWSHEPAGGSGISNNHSEYVICGSYTLNFGSKLREPPRTNEVVLKDWTNNFYSVDHLTAHTPLSNESIHIKEIGIEQKSAY